MKRLLNFGKWLLLTPVLSVLVYGVLGVAFSFVPTFPEEVACVEGQVIYLTSNGIHAEMILPAELLNRKLRSQLSWGRGADYFAFGWGDRGFYLDTPHWKDLRVSTALRALFLQSEAAMHVTALQDLDSGWKILDMCPDQLAVINSFLLRSFRKDNHTRLLEIENAGYGKNDRFYEARGNYTCMYNCNVWVTEALKKANVRTATWSPFDFGVLRYAR